MKLHNATQGNKTDYIRKYLFAPRLILLFSSVLFIVFHNFLPSSAYKFIVIFIYTECAISFWLTQYWWRNSGRIYVLSNWETKTSWILGFALIIWVLALYSPTGQLYIASSLGMALLLLHGELIKKIQLLSRTNLLLMPDSLADRTGPAVTVRCEQDIVDSILQASKKNKKVKVLGSRNSSKVYRELSSSPGGSIIIELASYDKVLHVDTTTKRITIQSGMTQGKLIGILKEKGWALNSLNGTDHTTLGGLIATGSFSASRYPFSDAIVGFAIVEANGSVLEINRDHQDFGAYLCSLGVLGVISTITLQCVSEFGIKGQSGIMSFAEMMQITKIEDFRFLSEWDYVLWEWYPHVDQMVKRFAKQKDIDPTSELKNLSTVGPLESYMAHVLTLVGEVFPAVNRMATTLFLKLLGTEYGDGFWANRITADPKLNLSYHPIDYIEVVIPKDSYVAYMTDLYAYYQENPKRITYGSIPTDWIASDKTTWIGKNAYDNSDWYAAITFIHQQIEKKPAAYFFEGPIQLGKKYNARMHWGKDPWLKNKPELEKSFPEGNFKRFYTLRYEKDPNGIFLNDFFSEVFLEKPCL